MRPNYHAVEIDEMMQHPVIVNFLVQARIRAALAAMLQNKVTEARVLLVGADNLCSGAVPPTDADIDTLHESRVVLHFAIELARQRGDRQRVIYLMSQLEA